ncbi:hypothetical protein J2Z22_004737 [Paenibacillus forsythiae]|uniref:YARHG domain-containing protein n=1 Tax=Paenibacillus forsythiae TaxID=365616 RepID=A0ABU3HGJ3_9BACL|nr:YARHG domain-containing protein [Paenibacillus forsythiae]MDT3429137.1 hypothetical protein [Paenibacillus forsythiae]
MNLRKILLLLGIAALQLQIVGCDPQKKTQTAEAVETQAKEEINSKDIEAAQGRDYLFKDSGKVLLTEANLSNLDGRMLELARNEIFARHGLVFKRQDLDAFFSAKRWYQPDPKYDGSLTEVENKNVTLIKKYEKLGSENKLEKIWDVDYHVLEYPPNKDSYKRQDADVDMNGDGTVDHIQIALLEEWEASGRWALSVNGAIVEVDLSMRDSNSYFQIVDADIQDKYFEIALENYSEDAQRWTDYYYYDGNQLIHMGNLDGLTGNSEAMNGNGKVLSSKQSYDFQCWYYLDEFKLDSNHMWKRVPKDFYPMEPPTPWVAKVRFPIYKAAGEQKILGWVEPGEKVYFLGGDTMGNGKLKTEDGMIGWIQVHDNKLSGTNESIEDCFDGLLLYG